MNKIVLQLFAVGLCFAVGHALQCYQCFGFWNLCPSIKKTCDAGEQCYSGIGKAAKVLDIKRKGCLAVASCNQTTTVNYPENNPNSTVYTITRTCCSTDLCNAAAGLPGASGSLALATLTALFVAKVLV
ncbi:sperm acrosome membrane-associated protein 4 [Betta splendens]|uniref:Sperm acrosome membrane-associated protein 4 n=1 Tax=Betta splendens TaxID=158456 RepID=A0A6P7NTJ0_BETSP|nr:sperm acrosome membrane-associated protein 4 [Betta splendens]